MKVNLSPINISAKTLPEAWFLCLQWLIAGGPHNHTYKIDQGSYAGQRRLEFDYVTVQVEYPNSRPIIPDVPVGVPAPTDMAYVERYLPYLMTDGPRQPNEEYTYGEYLVLQIQKVIEKYKAGPGNNQCYMTIGDKGSISQKDPPCLRGIDTRVLDGRLHFMVYFRSWDLWAGFPSNLAAVQLLKEYMADEMGLQDGNLIAASKGLHLYEYAWELARQVVNR